MTALGRIREEQEELAANHPLGSLDDTAWKAMHCRWLGLQRRALAILRGEACEEHEIAACVMCAVGRREFIPRDDHPYGAPFVDVPERPPSFPPIETMAVIDGDQDDARELFRAAITDRDPGDENDYQLDLDMDPKAFGTEKDTEELERLFDPSVVPYAFDRLRSYQQTPKPSIGREPTNAPQNEAFTVSPGLRKAWGGIIRRIKDRRKAIEPRLSAADEDRLSEAD